MKRIIIFAALAAFALTSCQQDITFEENKPEGLVFTATTEIPATKTELDGSLNVIWQAGDQIGIISNSNPGIYETETGGSTKASFSFKELTEATTAPFYAFYPTSLFTTSTFVLPATQSYVAGNISGNPMYAESSTTNLSFKNLCGIIKLNISTTQTGKKVRKIVLSADQGMSGEISNAATLGTDPTAAVSGTAGVTLDCGTEGVAIGSTTIPFYIAVPANTYSNLKIMVITTDDEFQTRTAKSDIVVGRSSITDITLGFNNLSAISNLVHYWPFNGNLNDAVTEGAIDATFIVNSETHEATLTEDRHGNANSAYSFDGYNIISIGHAGDFGTSSFTANMWICTTATTYDNTLIRTEGSSGGNGWFIRFKDSDIEIWASGNQYVSNTKINDGIWHMITFVHDTNNKVGQLYVDGVYKGGYTMSSVPNVSSDVLYTHVLGSGTHYRHCVYDGKMDEVRLYDKALTAEEVAALYQY
jgi:hypothetical protein